jgi:hypothetical protein
VLVSLTNVQRAELVANAEWLIGQNKHIGYGQTRPMPYLRTKAELVKMFSKGETINPDCSGSIVLLYYMTGGLIDPTGWKFTGYGNSSSMLSELKHYTDPRAAHLVALVVFGADLPLAQQHVAMVIKRNGADPELFSHGSAAGPIAITLQAEQQAHKGSTCFLDVGSL